MEHGTEPNRKWAFVSGASRGIGEAIARKLAEAGFSLVLTCSRTYPALEALGRELEDTYGICCRIFLADMGNSRDVERVFAGIPSLDVLVNNAGISYVGLLSEMSDKQWQRVMDVNLNSCFYTARAAIPLMLQKHLGHIINISSVWGRTGASMEVAYSASKGGVNAFTRALAKELAPSNIQVNAIACGLIDTSMNSCFSEEELDCLREEIPADRLGRPEEVAQLVLQLVRAPGYLTGQIVTIDGGWT